MILKRLIPSEPRRRNPRRLIPVGIVALLFLCAMPLPPATQSRGLDPRPLVLGSQPSSLRNWQAQDGLPQNSIQGIGQDRDGYLWFATFGGLARFDGIRFTVFNTVNTPGFPSDRLVSLYHGRDNSLWVGPEIGGLVQFKDGEWIARGRREGLPQEGANSICRDRNGGVWLGSETGLTGLRDGRVTRLTESGGKPLGRVNLLREDEDGLLVAATTGVHRLRDGTIRRETGFGEREVFRLLRDRTGNIWLGLRGSVVRYSSDGRAQTFPVPDSEGSKWESTCLLEDRAGTVWAGFEQAVYRIGPVGLEPVAPLAPLTNKNIRVLFEDHEGTLWIGTSGHGVFSFSSRAIAGFTAAPEGAAREAKAVFEDRSGTQWIIGRHVFRHFGNGEFSRFEPPGLEPEGDFLAGCEDWHGDIWLGGIDGLIRFHPGSGTVTRFTERDGLTDGVVFSLHVGRDGTLWAGTRLGLNRWNGRRFEAVGPNERTTRARVRFITEDAAGTIWIATDDGFGKFHQGAFTFFTTAEGLSNNLTRALRCEPNGTIWVGTYGGGLNHFKDGKFLHLTTAEGMFDNIVSVILEDGEGNFWLSGNRGIQRVNHRDLLDFVAGKIPRITTVGYDANDGMDNSETNGGSQPAGWRGADGRLWFPTLQGVVAVNPRQLNRQPPPVLVESLNPDGKTLAVREGMSLEPGLQKLEINYTALSFCIPAKVRFKYKLEGFDENWVEVGTRRTAYFTNLPPGTYRFRVLACNNDGVWNESGASFGFSLQPHYYQTKWFFALCGLGVFGFGIGINFWRIRRLKKKAAVLTRIVAERTETIRLEKDRTEAALVEAEYRKREAEKAHELKTNLLNLAAHDLKSPLTTIKGFTGLMQGGADETRLSALYLHYLSAIERESDRMLALLNELLLTAALENGNLRLRKRSTDLRMLAEDVVTLLRPQAEAKDQTVHLATVEAWVEVDPERFTEVLENLVNNAVKYSPPGKPIHVTVSRNGERVRFAVRDAGPGLTDNDKQRVFGKFQRLSAEPTGDETSIGLGLSIVKQLVELHGGRVGVESIRGRGSEFWVELDLISIPPGA